MRTALVRIGIVAAGATVIIAAALFAPLLLREIDAFRVRRVEVTGTRWLTAEEAAQAAGITRASNVFDDPTPWLDGLHANPLVVDVRIRRRLPGTVVLHVQEAVPVAFARTPELRPIAANGRILPADPARAKLDLPVLSVRTRVSGAGRAVDPETLRLVDFLAFAAGVEPGLIGWVSEVGVSEGAIRLVLRNTTDAEVLIDPQPTPERLRELNLTLGELATARAADSDSADAASDLSRVRRIDVRFHDQIVVSLYEGKS